MTVGGMTASRYWIGLAVFAMLAWSASAHAQAGKYPEKPVTIIADAPPGSTPDVDARFIAAGLSKLWRQQAVMINYYRAPKKRRPPRAPPPAPPRRSHC